MEENYFIDGIEELSIEDQQAAIIDQLDMDFKATFLTPQGKRVLEHLSKYVLLDDVCFNPDSFSKTAFALGARSVLLYIKGKLNQVKEDKRQVSTIEE